MRGKLFIEWADNGRPGQTDEDKFERYFTSRPVELLKRRNISNIKRATFDDGVEKKVLVKNGELKIK